MGYSTIYMLFQLSPLERLILRSITKIIEQKKFPTSIPELGFRQICKRNHTVYKNSRVGIVIKQFHLIVSPHTPLRVRIPTVYIGDGWVVQPLAIRKNAKEARDQLRKILGKFHTDLHLGNVGWILDDTGKSVPRLFDW